MPYLTCRLDAGKLTGVVYHAGPLIGSTLLLMRLTLFQKDDCHLCDAALLVLAQAGVADFESVWIDDDAVLRGRYGLRVPVLHCEDDGAELDWPFEAGQVREWLIRGRGLQGCLDTLPR